MRRILWVVDDDHDLVAAYVELFSAIPGLDLMTFTAPERLLEAYDNAPSGSLPQVIVTDNRMGRTSMTGVELIGQLRRRQQPLRIILVSGDPSLNCQAADVVIRKPFGIDEMISTVSSYLSN
jgi:FixJ family two-component response regulator